MRTRSLVLLVSTLLFIVILLAVGIPFAYRHAGPTFTFPTPKAITLVVGKAPSTRHIKFPNILPLQTNAAFAVEPLFPVGSVLEIDTTSPTVYPFSGTFESGVRVYRVDNLQYKDMLVSYRFDVGKTTSSQKRVRLRITGFGPVPVEAFHQRGWYYLKESYTAEFIQ